MGERLRPMELWPVRAFLSLNVHRPVPTVVRQKPTAPQNVSATKRRIVRTRASASTADRIEAMERVNVSVRRRVRERFRLAATTAQMAERLQEMGQERVFAISKSNFKRY